MGARLIEWRREAPGEYRGTDVEGSRWSVSQVASQAWITWRDGQEMFTTHSLTEAKEWAGFDVADSLDPGRAKRRAARRRTAA